MQFSAIERMQQRWEDYRPTKTHTFWIAAGCVAATLVLGFGPGGWVSGGTAQKRVDEAGTGGGPKRAPGRRCRTERNRTASWRRCARPSWPSASRRPPERGQPRNRPGLRRERFL